jgi:hypothetical protein
VRRIETKAKKMNITLEEVHRHKPDYKGNVEVELAAETEADLVVLKMALSDG